jgi:putative pyruvate formate lyase activating enzyme
VFCQNHDIAHQKVGFDLTPEELAEWMVKLQEVGNVHNINFVTPVSGRILLGSHPGG